MLSILWVSKVSFIRTSCARKLFPWPLRQAHTAHIPLHSRTILNTSSLLVASASLLSECRALGWRQLRRKGRCVVKSLAICSQELQVRSDNDGEQQNWNTCDTIGVAWPETPSIQSDLQLLRSPSGPKRRDLMQYKNFVAVNKYFFFFFFLHFCALLSICFFSLLLTLTQPFLRSFFFTFPYNFRSVVLLLIIYFCIIYD